MDNVKESLGPLHSPDQGQAGRREDVEGSLQGGGEMQSLVALPTAERLLSARDPALARIIASQPSRWPSQPTEEPMWALIRIVMAQQMSTGVACRLAERVKSAHPMLTTPSPATVPDRKSLRAFGLSGRRAEC